MDDFDLAAEQSEREQAVRALPFVQGDSVGELNFWSAKATGHQGTDVDSGEWFARLAINVARQFDMPELIAFILRDMTEAGSFGPLEAGFIAKVARAAKNGSMN